MPQIPQAVPPELAALLGGAASEEEPEEPQDPEEYLREALDLVRRYAQSEVTDDIDTERAEKITTLIQQILAEGQRGEQDLMAGKANPRALQRLYR